MPHQTTTVLSTFLAAASCLTAPAVAQWTVVSLHPEGQLSSEAIAIDSGVIVGLTQASVFTGANAAVWASTSASAWTNLDPDEDFWSSYAVGIDRGEIVGFKLTNIDHGGVVRFPNARLWKAPDAAPISLHPEGYLESAATAAHRGHQAGWVRRAGTEGTHAAMWNGSRDSLVDLHPEAADSSQVNAMNAETQAGWASFNGQLHAGLWNGTPGSWQDLHPDNGFLFSWVTDLDGETQVGQTLDTDADHRVGHASLWHGTPGSWVSLHPDGFIRSAVYAAFDGWQVGTVNSELGDSFIGPNLAALWNSTAESYEPLHEVLGDGWSGFRPADIWHDGHTLHIVGRATRAGGQVEAIVISRSLNPCPPDLNNDQRLNGRDIAAFVRGWINGTSGRDINNDGVLDHGDIIAFIEAFLAGC